MLSRDEQNPAPTGVLPWFAVRVRSNFERVALTHLRERGFEEFSPFYTTERQWSDRVKIIERPLFPGYVFTRLDLNNRLPVLSVPGVVKLVGFGGKPCPVPDEEIQGIRAAIQSGLPVSPHPYLAQGQAVILERGPLAGLQGIVLEAKNTLRLVISVNLLQRSIAVEVARNWLRPVTGADTHSRRTHGEWIETRAATNDAN